MTTRCRRRPAQELPPDSPLREHETLESLEEIVAQDGPVQAITFGVGIHSRGIQPVRAGAAGHREGHRGFVVS